jgi:cysteine desulfurase
MLVLRDLVAISNGSACTSESYEPSHVLTAMGLPELEKSAATRWSWSHLTQAPDWPEILRKLKTLS